jgi:hypothetical protein
MSFFQLRADMFDWKLCESVHARHQMRFCNVKMYESILSILNRHFFVLFTSVLWYLPFNMHVLDVLNVHGNSLYTRWSGIPGI